MSQADDTTFAVTAGLKDDAKGLELLKQKLTENGFKHTQTAANIMLAEMRELGLDEDAALYYQTLAAVNLPETEARL